MLLLYASSLAMSSIMLALSCIILGWASCLVHVWCVYHVVCFFSIVPVSLRSWGFVRLRLVRLLHGLIFLPSGISGKMTVTLDLTTIIAMLAASFYRFAALPITCSSSLPKCHEPLTFFTLPSKPLFGYVTALLSPSYSVASCRWRWRLLHVGLCLCWDIKISLILLMHLYTW